MTEYEITLRIDSGLTANTLRDMFGTEFDVLDVSEANGYTAYPREGGLNIFGDGGVRHVNQHELHEMLTTDNPVTVQ